VPISKSRGSGRKRVGGRTHEIWAFEPLVATYDGAILPARQDRLDEAELAQASGQGIELGLTDPPRIGRIRAKEIDRDLFDREGGERHCARRAVADAVDAA
jgi:hypothetical protein